MKNPAQKVDSGTTMAEMWEGFAAMVLADAPPGVQDAMKGAFYAGASCLFNWFMVQMDEGEEPTNSDLNRVSLMQTEIQGFFVGEKRH